MGSLRELAWAEWRFRATLVAGALAWALTTVVGVVVLNSTDGMVLGVPLAVVVAVATWRRMPA